MYPKCFDIYTLTAPEGETANFLSWTSIYREIPS